MKRRSGLRRTGALLRHAALTSKTSLTRRTPLPRVSAKRAAENRERRAMKDRLWPNGVRPRCVVPWCTELADDIHEPLTRARGGPIDHPDNGEPCCRQHNGEMTLEPKWAYDLDLVIHSWDPRPLAQQAADRRAKLAAWQPGEAA